MRSCSNCKRKNRCVKVCPEVESRLPKDYTGRDPKVEVCMAPEDLGVVVDMYSYALWAWAETASRRPAPDLSRLTPKEKNALMLIAQGMSMRGAAKRLGINLNALQCRVASARRKLSAGRFPYITKGGGVPPKSNKEGGR